MVTWASYDGPLGHELWELDVNTGETRRLTDPDVTPFKIANGDWAVSPDGRHVAFGEPGSQHLVADTDGLNKLNVKKENAQPGRLTARKE